MKQQTINEIINKAKDICARSGGRLTDKRRQVLKVLLSSPIPLSAYEITSLCSDTAEKPMPAMSVYRILEFLQNEDLVHKLSSTNKFVACSHISCNHAHDIPQFLICGQCQSAKEITISKQIFDQLSDVIANAGYTLTKPQLELQCLCNDCSAQKAS